VAIVVAMIGATGAVGGIAARMPASAHRWAA
jgi:hypothetical protein